MPTVLHVIDGISPQATPSTLALLADAIGRTGPTQHRVLLLGGSDLQRQAQALDIPVLRTVGVPCGQAMLGWPRSARALRHIIASQGVDLVHAWSVGAFTLSALAARKTPRLLSVTAPIGLRAVHWLRLLVDQTAAATFLPISNTLRRELISGGVAESAVHVLRPGLDMSRVSAAARATLRQRWEAPEDQTKVVALLGDPWHAVDALAGAMALGIAQEVLQTRGQTTALRLLLHPDQRHRHRAERMLEPLGRLSLVIREPALVRPWEVLPGCDLALAIGPGAGNLSTLWAMAANVPIIAEATYAVSEILEAQHSALLAKPDQPKLLANRITQLLDDRLLAWKLRDSARHEAYSFFSRQRYCESLQAVYHSVLEGKPVQVPELPSTGGLRFSGRA